MLCMYSTWEENVSINTNINIRLLIGTGGNISSSVKNGFKKWLLLVASLNCMDCFHLYSCICLCCFFIHYTFIKSLLCTRDGSGQKKTKINRWIDCESDAFRWVGQGRLLSEGEVPVFRSYQLWNKWGKSPRQTDSEGNFGVNRKPKESQGGLISVCKGEKGKL